MPLYPLKKIGELAAGRRAYLRGADLYKAGRVRSFGLLGNGAYSEYVAARVEDGDGEARHVEVGFGADGAVSFMECSCGAFRESEGACPHIVAALVHKYYADMVDGLRADGRALEPAALAACRTDEAAKGMLRAYVAGQAAALAADAAFDTDAVTLTPALWLSGRGPLLTFTLTGRRTYVLKDIARFCTDLENGAVAEYGKGLRLWHHPDAFAAESRPLLRFLLAEWADIRALRQGAGGLPGTRLGRELPLSPGALDRFFALYAGRAVPCRLPDSEEARELHFVDGEPRLTVTVQRAQEKHGFTVTCPAALDSALGQSLYLADGDTLRRCGADYTAHVAPFCAAMRRGRGELFLADGDIAEFCTGVMPHIRPYVTLEGRADLLEDYLPMPFEAEVYLDAPAPEMLTARVVCVYGEERIDPYQEAAGEGVRRDRLGEWRVRLVLQKYFFSYTPAEGHLLLRGDEAIYRFVTEGVADVATVAAVYATDAFRRAGLAPPPRVQVGVRLNSGVLDIGFDPGEYPLEELAGMLHAYRQKKAYHRLRDGRFVRLGDEETAGFLSLADGLNLTDRELAAGGARVPAYRALYIDRVLHETAPLRGERDAAFRQLVEDMRAAGEAEEPVPASLAAVLRPYQATGFRWLKAMERHGFGAVLADDMGLGKTIQVIALLLDARERGNDRPSLVVCPASLVLNWESEIRRFAPALTVLTVIGDAAQRAALLRRVNGYDVAVTSYDLLKRDIEQYRGRVFRYHILDEAQVIKNHTTQNARAAKAIESRQRYALTGTPVENRLSELWSLFDFLMPGFLYTYAQFRERYELPAAREENPRALEQLGRLTGPFILRRMKQEVLRELPPKTETVLYAALEGEQRKLYLANVAATRRDLKRELEEQGMQRGRFAILAMLTRLRQLCCDPALCYEDYAGGSAKLEMCLELLREATGAGHKVLLFSQFTSMLSILEGRLQAEGLRYYLLQGSTPKEKRAQMVEAFNRDDTEVFLISLKAGGTGLNLTGADVVIHYDPWWNVAAQNQATDRAYRIGQTDSVQVYRLIVRDTVEEKILRLQENKQALADAIIREGDGAITALSADELLDLLD